MESQIMDIRQLFCLTILVRQHKNKSELEEIDHTYQTRYGSNTNRIPKTEKTIVQRCYFYLGLKIHNFIPSDLKKINSINLRILKYGYKINLHPIFTNYLT